MNTFNNDEMYAILNKKITKNSSDVNFLTEEVNSHIDDTDVHVTANDKAKWNGYENTKANKTDILSQAIAENHNNIFRGDDLFAKGYDINDICAMIADGSFSDIYIGDYFTLSGSIENVPCFVEQTGDDVK